MSENTKSLYLKTDGNCRGYSILLPSLSFRFQISFIEVEHKEQKEIKYGLGYASSGNFRENRTNIDKSRAL